METDGGIAGDVVCESDLSQHLFHVVFVVVVVAVLEFKKDRGSYKKLKVKFKNIPKHFWSPYLPVTFTHFCKTSHSLTRGRQPRQL